MGNRQKKHDSQDIALIILSLICFHKFVGWQLHDGSLSFWEKAYFLRHGAVAIFHKIPC
jgi:hypothetical protein